MSVDTLLFDLDGTLVDQFLPGSSMQFAWLLIRRFRGLAPAGTTYRAAKTAIHALHHHDGKRTNFDVVVETFCEVAGLPVERVAALYQTFAEKDFPAMGWRFHAVPGAPETVRWARDQGYRLVLATNPTVPLKMITDRAAWAGLGDVEWAFITHPQIMRSLKPSVRYYEELMAHLQTEPGRCLMIGNDFLKDTPAKAVGVPTFILDRPQNRKQRRLPRLYEPDHVGTYADLKTLLSAESLPLHSERRGGGQPVN
jgi:FMN phosphatase YigB (HAD superfamily)